MPQQAKKPNILVIFGDDIGQSNISAYTHGVVDPLAGQDQGGLDLQRDILRTRLVPDFACRHWGHYG